MTDMPDHTPMENPTPHITWTAYREATEKRDRELSEWETKMEDEIWNPERMTEPERQPLRDRLLYAAGKHNKDDELLTLLSKAVEAIDFLTKHYEATNYYSIGDLNEMAELKAANAKQKQVIDDWIGHPGSGMENSYELIVEKQQRAIETYRKCLKDAEGTLKEHSFTSTLKRIRQIKEEGGIE